METYSYHFTWKQYCSRIVKEGKIETSNIAKRRLDVCCQVLRGGQQQRNKAMERLKDDIRYLEQLSATLRSTSIPPTGDPDTRTEPPAILEARQFGETMAASIGPTVQQLKQREYFWLCFK